jgi:hypothetical protein
MQKPKVNQKSEERLIYDKLNREQQKKVEKKFCERTGCSRATFYEKLNGNRKVRPYEKDLLTALLIPTT